MNKDEAIMRLFKSYIDNQDNKNLNIDKMALKKGIYIYEDCDKNIIKLACEIWGKDAFLLNQTFHKSFNTVVNNKDEDLILMQILHYFTTYGLEKLNLYNEENIYIPKEKLEIKELKEDVKLIKINKITEKELSSKLFDLCISRIGLSKNTINCINVLKEYIDINIEDIYKVKNKEIKVIVYEKYNILPKDEIEFIRYFIYVLTKRTLLIKDKLTINKLKECDKKKAFYLIDKYIKLYGIKNLSKVFNRFKVLFLAVKSKENLELNHLINRISKLSKKYNEPMVKNELNDIVNFCIRNNNENIEKIINEKVDFFQAVKLKNYLEYKKLNLMYHVYKIRNGKIYIKEKLEYFDLNVDYVIKLLDEIIIKKLKSKVNNKKIYLENDIDFALPQSEKQFAGNVPFGSVLNLEKENLIVGIYWKNVNNERVDLDLKLISNEYSIGWDKRYKEEDKLIFTGDITNATNGASEYIYIDKSILNGIFSIKVNNYTKYVDNVDYDIIIAKGYKDKLKENYIVDVNDIIIKIPFNKIEIGNSEHSIGTILINNDCIKFIFTDLCTSNNITSDNNNLEDILRKYLVNQSLCICKFKEYLKKSGAILIKDNKEFNLDFSIENLNKYSFIKLFK